jgi:hypothetical protein
MVPVLIAFYMFSVRPKPAPSEVEGWYRSETLIKLNPSICQSLWNVRITVPWSLLCCSGSF